MIARALIALSLSIDYKLYMSRHSIASDLIVLRRTLHCLYIVFGVCTDTFEYVLFTMRYCIANTARDFVMYC